MTGSAGTTVGSLIGSGGAGGRGAVGAVAAGGGCVGRATGGLLLHPPMVRLSKARARITVSPEEALNRQRGLSFRMFM
jgi:hypothetical protein